MTRPQHSGGGKRLVSMSSIRPRPANRIGTRARGGSGPGGSGAEDDGPGREGGRGATVPRRARGMRRPSPEWERPSPQAPSEVDDDAVTETLPGPGAITGVPTTPSRIPLPASSTGDAPATEAASADPGPGPETPAAEPARDSGRDDALGGLVPMSSAEPEPAAADTRRRRRLVWPVVAGVLVLALAGGAFFARDLWGVFFPPDFAGPGTGHVVVRVADGDSTRNIGESLVAAGVVASARGFGNAAEDDPRGRGIQPGSYDMQRGMPAARAVTRMLDPGARLGQLEVRGGTQLDDTVGAGSSRVPGVLSMISAATCVVEDSGARRCTSVDDLRRTMATTDPARLGVPDWALDGVRRAIPERRLEGLVAPGTYDVSPGADAATALTSVLRASAGRLQDGGLVARAAAQNVTPYEALIVGSLAEREGVEQDFGKIARVVYNRLPIPMRLQLDSTINYPLDRQTLLTTPFDRAAPGPYNTYLDFGLPPTPIGSVSAPALRAALAPDPGPWIYFVKCRPDGASCFAVTPAEHDANRRLAQQRGAY